MRVTLKLIVVCHLFHPFTHTFFKILCIIRYILGTVLSKVFPLGNGSWVLTWGLTTFGSGPCPLEGSESLPENSGVWLVPGWKLLIYVNSFILQMKRPRPQWSGNLPKRHLNSFVYRMGVVSAPKWSYDSESITSISSATSRPCLPSPSLR